MDDSKEKLPDAYRRGSREVWLRAAYDSLIDSGVEAVRIQPLSKKLDLSRTSFYWFFKDREDVLAALMDLWREKNTDSVIKQTRAYAESINEAVLNVFDCWFDTSIFDAQFEFAVRSWALQSADVGDEIQENDQARLRAMSDMFARFGFEPGDGEVRARTMYLTQIGYISMKAREDLEVRMARIPHYLTIFTDKRSKSQEIARFYARHSFKPGFPIGATEAA